MEASSPALAHRATTSCPWSSASSTSTLSRSCESAKASRAMSALQGNDGWHEREEVPSRLRLQEPRDAVSRYDEFDARQVCTGNHALLARDRHDGGLRGDDAGRLALLARRPDVHRRA